MPSTGTPTQDRGGGCPAGEGPPELQGGEPWFAAESRAAGTGCCIPRLGVGAVNAGVGSRSGYALGFPECQFAQRRDPPASGLASAK